MSKKNIILLGLLAGLILVGCSHLGSTLRYYQPHHQLGKIKKVIYFEPSVFPEIEEIQEPTNQAFFGAVADQSHLYSGVKTVIINQSLDYDNIDNQYIKEIGENNSADAIIVPKVKYFKVGFGKYVFSNQVLVSLKLYDRQGNLLIETEYDTYKGNARLTGKAENSIRIGTQGALKILIKALKSKKMLHYQ